MYFMLDHIRLFDFINVSEWISPVHLRLSAPERFLQTAPLSSELQLKVEVCPHSLTPGLPPGRNRPRAETTPGPRPPMGRDRQRAAAVKTK